MLAKGKISEVRKKSKSIFCDSAMDVLYTLYIMYNRDYFNSMRTEQEYGVLSYHSMLTVCKKYSNSMH